MRLRYDTYSLAQGFRKIKTRTLLVLSAAGLLAGSGGMTLAIMSTAHADSTAINFESPQYSLGDINGQNGWSKTGAYDAAVATNGSGYASFGSQSLRISNAVTSGSFGDQTFAPKLTEQAGEPGAWDASGNPVASPKSHFEAQFDLASATKADQGMSMSVSPDNGVGARMSYLRFDDTAGGITVAFDDVTDPGHVINGDSFNESNIATLSYNEPHTVKFVMDFVSGADNDVVKVYIDGSLVKTGTSWEDYYRFDSESNPTLANVSRTVDTLLFREGGTAVSANSGNGYLIDNLSMSSQQYENGCQFDESVPGTWTLLADCTSVAEINVPTNTTLDGAGHTITAGFTKTDNSNNAVLGVIGDDGVTIENLTINGVSGDQLHGIVAYVSTNVNINHVTLNNTDRIGIDVNGSDVTVSDVTTVNSGWEGFDVDSGSGVTQPSTLTVSGPMNQFNDARDIYVDSTTKTPASTVTDTLGQYTFQTTGINPNDRLYTELLARPTITSPANNSELTSAQLTSIDWSDVTSPVGTVTYQYRAYGDAGYTSPIYDSGNTLTTSQIPTPNTPNGIYYVQVRATDSLGNQSAWSNDASNPFKITVRELTSPTNADQCKNNGWKTFSNPSFKNHGDCVSWVQHNVNGNGTPAANKPSH